MPNIFNIHNVTDNNDILPTRQYASYIYIT